MPRRIVAHLCNQLEIEPSIAADYAARAPTRYEHLGAIHAAFGIWSFAQTDRLSVRGYKADACALIAEGHDASSWRRHNYCE